MSKPARRIASTVLALAPLTCHAAWEVIPPLPTPNGGFACAVSKGKIVVLGGTNWKDGRKYWLDVIWVFDPKTKQWEVKGKLPNSLAFPVVGEAGDAVYLAGGFDGAQSRKEIWRLNPDLSLTQAGELNEARSSPVGGYLGGKLIAGAGFKDPATLEGGCPGMELYSFRNSRVATFDLPSKNDMGLGASATLGKQLYVFGGASHDAAGAFINTTNSWGFAPATGKWSALAAYPMTIRGNTAIVLDDRHIFVGGGGGGPKDDFTASAYLYDVKKDVFKRTVDLPIAALVGLVKLDGFVYCLGGEDRSKHRTDFCARIAVKELLHSAK